MQRIVADLHLHSVLSPCAEKKMIPSNIYARAKAMGIDLIGITDHNSAENVTNFVELAKEYGIYILPGMEVQTKEEVHLLTFFSEINQLLKWQKKVYDCLPEGKNNSNIFGEQCLINSLGTIEGNLQRLLLTSISMNVKEVFEQVESLNGLCIPAHIDRPKFGILGQLGGIPRDLRIEGVEISPYFKPKEKWTTVNGNELGVICSSDAHYLEDVGKGKTLFYINEITLPELRLALRGEKGRRTEVL